MQNFKEDKPQPVRDEYEYVSDDGELKIDEFPIRRKKNAPKRDLSCEWRTGAWGGPARRGRADIRRGHWWPVRPPRPKPPLTAVYSGRSLTGQEGAPARACHEAKAGHSAL